MTSLCSLRAGISAPLYARKCVYYYRNDTKYAKIPDSPTMIVVRNFPTTITGEERYVLPNLNTPGRMQFAATFRSFSPQYVRIKNQRISEALPAFYLPILLYFFRDSSECSYRVFTASVSPRHHRVLIRIHLLLLTSLLVLPFLPAPLLYQDLKESTSYYPFLQYR